MLTCANSFMVCLTTSPSSGLLKPPAEVVLLAAPPRTGVRHRPEVGPAGGREQKAHIHLMARGTLHQEDKTWSEKQTIG